MGQAFCNRHYKGYDASRACPDCEGMVQGQGTAPFNDTKIKDDAVQLYLARQARIWRNGALIATVAEALELRPLHIVGKLLHRSDLRPTGKEGRELVVHELETRGGWKMFFPATRDEYYHSGYRIISLDAWCFFDFSGPVPVTYEL